MNLARDAGPSWASRLNMGPASQLPGAAAGDEHLLLQVRPLSNISSATVGLRAFEGSHVADHALSLSDFRLLESDARVDRQVQNVQTTLKRLRIDRQRWKKLDNLVLCTASLYHKPLIKGFANDPFGHIAYSTVERQHQASSADG